MANLGMTALMAPTGKAAKRMDEVIGFGPTPTTIHRALAYQPDGLPGHDASNPLPFERIIVDESSMIDIELMAHLLRATPRTCSVVFVGDGAQLPPVGPGQPFRDMLEIDGISKIELTEVHRAAQDSWVCRESPKIRDGQWPDLTETHDFVFSEGAPASLRSSIVATVRYLWGQGEDDMVVLTPQHKGPLGRIALNELLQAARWEGGRPRAWSRAKIQGDAANIYIGDPVMQTINDYEKGVFNGEVGTAVDIRQHVVPGKKPADMLFVAYPGREELVPYDMYASYSLMLAYAMTIHKSQGSEWRTVLTVCHSAHDFMLNRGLFYTAVTRTKDSLILFGDRGGIGKALRTPVSTRRTKLKEAV